MAGFGKITLVGEYYNQRIVNVFHYRSTAWLPGQGNPFDDTLAFVDAFLDHCKAAFMDCMGDDYTLRTAEGVGYNDSYGLVTSSPVIRTVDEAGHLASLNSMGAAACAIVGLRCGEQHSINGTGISPRNRGYLAVGPIGESYVDNYSHIIPAMVSLLGTFAATLDDTITVLTPAVQLIPIRIHEKYVGVGPLRILSYRTYSDVTGYRINNVSSYRRSRVPEA